MSNSSYIDELRPKHPGETGLVFGASKKEVASALRWAHEAGFSKEDLQARYRKSSAAVTKSLNASAGALCVFGDWSEDRFWRLVVKTDSCWLWPAPFHYGIGYGYCPDLLGERCAHRVAWALTNGPIPDDIHVLHHCDNPPCVRPEHLFLGTPQDNYDDMVEKGRAWWQTRAETFAHADDRNP